MTRRELDRLWTPHFVLAMGVNLFVMMVFYLLMTTLALYAVERFAASDSIAGLTSGIYVVGAVVSRMFAGKYLDLIGRRRMLLSALLVFSIAAALYAPVDSLVLLLIVRFIHGAAFGVASTTITASVQSLIPRHRRGEGTGYFGMAVTVATALGPFAAVAIIDGAGYPVLFIVSAACSITALLIALLLKLPERYPTEDEIARKWKIRVSDLFDPSTLPIATILFVSGVLYSGIVAFLSSYVQRPELGGGASGFFAVYAVAVLVSRFFVGRIQDRRGDNAVIYPALIAFGIGLGVLAIAPNGFVVAIAGAFAGFGFGSLMTCGQAIAVNLAPDHRVGIAISTFYLMIDGGLGLGPIPIGMLVSAFGYQGMYAIAGLAMIGVIVLYHVLHGRRANRGSLRS